MKLIFRNGLVLFLFFFFSCASWAAQDQQQAARQPITVNGDTVEFKTEGREMTAEGHVVIVHQDSTLTCDKVKVFMDEKIAIAEGHVKFVRKSGEELEGDTIVYDFSASSGTIIYPDLHFAPYYGKADVMEKVSDTEFLISDGVISTCDLPDPHWTLKCHELTMNPGESMSAKGIVPYILGIPIMYIPALTQKLTDDKPIFMVLPGHKSQLGTYFLGSYRYFLSDDLKGQLHLNWYQKRGWAEGADLNYNTKIFGLGNARYFRVNDAIDSNGLVLSGTTKERSMIELRHKWFMDPNDSMVLEYYRQSDINLRKDYFYREYEKVTNPKTFFLYSHVFPNATLSLDAEPRINKFDAVLERIPELKLETVNQRITGTPFYYKNTTSASELVNLPANLSSVAHVMRIDTSNQVAYIFRFMDVDFNPFAGYRDTYFSRGITKSDELRNMYFTGIDLSTKLFKVYNVSSDYLGLNIDKVRHIVTPSIQYRYEQKPNVLHSMLQQFDAIDALDKQNLVTFNLENKLQTKRRGEAVDLATLILSTDYSLERVDTATSPATITNPSGFQDVRYKLEFKPYESWELDSDAEYDLVNKFFRTINSDFWTKLGWWNTTFGYRYKKGESSQMTTGFTCPLNPFWKLGIYERFEFRTGSLMEQQYTLDRDLHCWTMQFIISQRKAEGVSFFVAFKLKAFPEIGIHAEKTFTAPRTSTP